MENFPQNSKENSTPFKETLLKSDVSEQHKELGKLYEFKNNPDKVVRVISFDSIREDYGNQADPIELAVLGRKLYAELETKYDIPVAVDYVVGEDESGRDVVYGITDRITASNENNEITPRMAEQFEKLYISLSQYYLDKSNKLSDGESYLTDINSSSQYAYGTKVKNEQPAVYLVDTDLYIRNDKVSFYYVVAWLMRHITEAEKALGKRFDVARDNIKKIIATPQLEGLSAKEEANIQKAITEVNNFLEGRFSEESGKLPTGIFNIP